MTPQQRTPPPAQQLGAALLLQGQGVLDGYYLALAGIRYAKNQGHPTTRFEQLAAIIGKAAEVSRQRHYDVVLPAAQAESEIDGEVFIDTAAAAALLGGDIRTAQRLAGAGLGRRVVGRWILEKSLVIAELEARRNDETLKGAA